MLFALSAEHRWAPTCATRRTVAMDSAAGVAPEELLAALRDCLRDLWSEQRCQATIEVLQRQAAHLAASIDHRVAQGAVAELWHPLASLWVAVCDLISADEERFIPLATALAIFLRNLVAGVSENQSRVYGLCHLRLDRLLVLCSALVKLQRPHCAPSCRWLA